MRSRIALRLVAVAVVCFAWAAAGRHVSAERRMSVDPSATHPVGLQSAGAAACSSSRLVGSSRPTAPATSPPLRRTHSRPPCPATARPTKARWARERRRKRRKKNRRSRQFWIARQAMMQSVRRCGRVSAQKPKEGWPPSTLHTMVDGSHIARAHSCTHTQRSQRCPRASPVLALQRRTRAPICVTLATARRTRDHATRCLQAA
jgi:hypothetical protein